jgi:hypothetical protein
MYHLDVLEGKGMCKHALIVHVDFKFPVIRRNIKGRPFWSRVLSVWLEPTTERSALNG